MVAYDNTLGAVFIGGWVAAIFYGITCVQAFFFLWHKQNTDRRSLKYAVRVRVPAAMFKMCLGNLCTAHCLATGRGVMVASLPVSSTHRTVELITHLRLADTLHSIFVAKTLYWYASEGSSDTISLILRYRYMVTRFAQPNSVMGMPWYV